MPEPPIIISFHYINLYLYITYNLIQMLFIKPRRKPSPKKKHEVPVDNPIASLAVLARQIGPEPFEVPWNDTFF